MDMTEIFRRLVIDRRGVSALELSFLAGVLGFILIHAFDKLGVKLSEVFHRIGGHL